MVKTTKKLRSTKKKDSNDEDTNSKPTNKTDSGIEKPTRTIRKRNAIVKRKKLEVKELIKPKSTARKSVRPRRQKKPTIETVDHLWNDWKNIYLVGTEWSQYDEAYKIRWDFDHLEEALFEGMLKDKTVYIFGATEPQMITMKDGQNQVVHIPVLIAVVGDIPPPSTLGIKSVQMEKEEIVPMKDMKMDWVPYIPRSAPTKYVPKIFFLQCKARREVIKRMKPELVKKYEYCMPYILKLEDMLRVDYDTVVNVICSVDGKSGLAFEFDWEMDDLTEFVDTYCKENEIENKEAIRNAIKTEVRKQKAKIKEEKEEKKKKLEALPDKVKEAMKNMKFYKFYPQNKEPNIEQYKSIFINRYYGKATAMFPEQGEYEKITLPPEQ